MSSLSATPPRNLEIVGRQVLPEFDSGRLRDPYKHIVVQDCVISDRPYWAERGWHGGGLIWYTTQGCLVEDCRFERIERGQAIMDKDNGWGNTYRNNVLHGDFMVAAQGCADGIHIDHNFICGNVQIGSQPGWLRNVWLHHNAICGGVSLMGGATRGPEDEVDLDTGELAGPRDPDAQALVRDVPRERRLLFAWGNVIDVPDGEPNARYQNQLVRLSDTPKAFPRKYCFVSWDGNLMDAEAVLAVGWGQGTITWSEFIKACGYEANGAVGKFVFDDEGHLPADSPWRETYGRDAGLLPRMP